MQENSEQLVYFLGSWPVALRTLHANAAGERDNGTKDSIASTSYM